MRPRYDRPAHRTVARIGWVLMVVGLIGIVLVPRLLIVWAVLIGFGAPSAIRAIRDWRRRRPSR